jgi:hypothetical protein
VLHETKTAISLPDAHRQRRPGRVSDPRTLSFTRSAEKELRRLDPPIRTRVLVALDRLLAKIAPSMSAER